jgi:hypothetical protein
MESVLSGTGEATMNESSSKFYVAFALLTFAAVAVAPAAQAFTIDDGGGKSSTGTAKNAVPTSPFYDSAKKYDLDTKDDAGTLKFGNGGSISFGPARSPEDEYRRGVDRMFSPLGRPPN